VIPVVWVDKRMLCWDQAMLDEILSDLAWPTGYEFEHRVGFDGIDASGAVVVVPGRYHAGSIAWLNAELARFEWVLLIVTSDEENLFPLGQVQHPNMRAWVQTPGAKNADGYLPVGYPPHLRGHLSDVGYGKPEGWFFSGQVNNPRRKQCVEALRGVDGGSHIETPGFTQGLPHDAYALRVARARIVPCPSGPHTVDTFRACEALEAGCLPVLDGQTPDGDGSWYWPTVFPGLKAPVLDDWDRFPGLATDLLIDWPANGNRASAWWQGYKRTLAHCMSDAIKDLSGTLPEAEPITVLVPTSPIASHPDTAVIEETIASVRHWLPDAEIIVMCDGVRPEQEYYRQRYEDYLQRLVWLTGRMERVLPVVHDDHLHQGELTKKALDLVRTPLVLFVEHDTPLVTDCLIDFPALTAAALSGEADCIRFHHEALVLPDHEHLMLDSEPRDVHGAPLLRTVQWSQRPHLASTGFYRRLLAQHFDGTRRAMIEDAVHGPVHDAWREFGLAGWDRYRLWMYAPGGNIKRSYHLDGRGEDQKWELE
jgi:hypothetical protein